MNAPDVALQHDATTPLHLHEKQLWVIGACIRGDDRHEPDGRVLGAVAGTRCQYYLGFSRLVPLLAGHDHPDAPGLPCGRETIRGDSAFDLGSIAWPCAGT